MLKNVLIGLAVAVLAFVGFVASRPAAFTIVRSATVAAPADIVFTQISDFNKWGAWSAWAKMDPTQKDTIGGTPSTVGHTDAWVGNESGEGRMTITEVKASEQLKIKLEFIKPFATTNEIIFDFKPAGDGTTVTWTMNGNNGFLGKAFSVFVDMDKMVGAQFEQGLADMAKIAVAEAKARPPTAEATPE